MNTEQNIPRHIAIVLDGNGRWARAKHRPRFMGHKKGVEAVSFARVIRFTTSKK